MSFKFRKVNPNAPAPHRSHDSDSGFDLCLVEHVKTEMGVSWYDTGIAVQPPDGYYFEVYGRSSIAKSGYMLQRTGVDTAVSHRADRPTSAHPTHPRRVGFPRRYRSWRGRVW